MGWFFSEQTVSDFRIDAQVKIIEGDKPVGPADCSPDQIRAVVLCA